MSELYLRLIRKTVKNLNSKADVAIWIIALIFATLYSTISIVRHSHFQSGAFDLGLYDQAIWQYSKFLFPFNTIKMRFILADHLTLNLTLLAPLYWIWDNVIILLIFQATWVSLSIVGLFKFIKIKGFSGIESVLLSSLYITFYGTQYAIFFDFHPVMIAVGIIPWLLLFWEQQRTKLIIACIILLLTTQENMGIALSSLSLYWFFHTKYLKQAIITGVIGLIYTALAFYTINFISDVGLEYTPHLPQTATQLAQEFYNSSEKQEVWLYTYSWFSFLPLLSPVANITIITDLAQYFITGPQYARMWSPFMHHRAILGIYTLLGTIVALKLLNKRLRINTTILILFLVLSALFQQFHFNFALTKLLKPSFWQKQAWISDNNYTLSQIPTNARVAAQHSLVPQLSHREQIYLIYPRKNSFKQENSPCELDSCWWLDFAGEPEYLVLDTHPDIWLTMLLEERNNFTQAIENMESSGVIELYISKGGAKVYTINHEALKRIK